MGNMRQSSPPSLPLAEFGVQIDSQVNKIEREIVGTRASGAAAYVPMMANVGREWRFLSFTACLFHRRRHVKKIVQLYSNTRTFTVAGRLSSVDQLQWGARLQEALSVAVFWALICLISQSVECRQLQMWLRCRRVGVIDKDGCDGELD
jgi:hypothetical protein